MKCIVYGPNREPKEYEGEQVAIKLAKDLINKKIYHCEWITKIKADIDYKTGEDIITIYHNNGFKEIYRT